MQETRGPRGENTVDWYASGEIRGGVDGQDQVWLSLNAEATLPLECQRCLQSVETQLTVERKFRFVRDEATAEAEDETSDEDLLVLEKDFDLKTLIEDELLMAIPLIPHHEICPIPVQLEAADADFDAATSEKANPFSALAALRGGKSG